eukprot:jgi/Psemu1/24048/gm1.24048_g
MTMLIIYNLDTVYSTSANCSLVLPIKYALQGHPESGRLCEEHINHNLTSPEQSSFSAKLTTSSSHVLTNIAIKIYNVIGKCLQHASKDAPPFKYLGLPTSYNGVDILQTQIYLEITCDDYIDRLVRTHGWTATTNIKLQSHPTSPLPDKALNQMYIDPGPLEGTSEHLHLQMTHGFFYCTLIGKLLYAYTTCCHNTGFSISTLSKFSTTPAPIHNKYLKDIALCLHGTKHWGLHYQHSTKQPHTDLPICSFSDSPILFPPELHAFPSLPTGPTITCFVDAAYSNVHQCHKSTSGLSILLANTVIISAEAKFYAVSPILTSHYTLESHSHKGGPIITNFLFRRKGEKGGERPIDLASTDKKEEPHLAHCMEIQAKCAIQPPSLPLGGACYIVGD